MVSDHQDEMHPAQVAAIRRMSPGQRLDAAVEMIHAARRFQAAALAVQHPDWSQAQIRDEVRRRWLYADT